MQPAQTAKTPSRELPAMRVSCSSESSARLRGLAIVILAVAAIAHHARTCAADDYEAARREMLRAIERTTILTAQETGRPALSAPVLSVMGKVARHLFVPAGQQRYAYENRPLPIGFGQTISQPYIVALMTDLHAGRSRATRVLEIGTGSGYQAAVLAELGARRVHHRDRRAARPLGCAAPRAPRLPQRRGDGRRRLLRVARARALRRASWSPPPRATCRRRW